MALHLRHFTDRDQRPPLTLDPQASHALESADWPGNVRELVNCAHYIASLAQGPIVGLTDLPPQMMSAPSVAPEGQPAQPEVDLDLPYKAAKRKWMDAFEDRYIIALLTRHGGNVSAAARDAGMDRRSIQRMLKRIRGD
jgi:DNA-binding NtrC family response regulator